MFKSLKTRFKALEHGNVGTFGNDISTPKNLRRAHWHFHLFDHAFLRVWWTNLTEIAPGVWRSNQPSPARIRQAADQGIKTIISFRGTPNISFYLLEKKACEDAGITYIPTKLAARAALPADSYLSVLELFDTTAKPFLFHCKSGADRAGIAAALYLLHVEKIPLEVAKKQLSFRFMHLKSTKTGVLDHILDVYGQDIEKHGPIEIKDWLENYYDQNAVRNSFHKWTKFP